MLVDDTDELTVLAVPEPLLEEDPEALKLAVAVLVEESLFEAEPVADIVPDWLEEAKAVPD